MRLVGAEQLDGGLAALAPVAEAVFGARERAPGWFERKLAREGVEAELSAFVAGDDHEILGYALLGRAPSRGPIARGAGLGLVAGVRGRGWGRALVDFVAARARARGCTGVEFLAERERLAWYLELGFAPVRTEWTLAASGAGEDLDLVQILPAATPLGRDPLWSWFPEAWQRSPAGRRLALELGCGRVWLVREGRAWVAVRAELAAAARPAELLAALRGRLTPATPLVLYPCPAERDWVTEALSPAGGFTCIQRATLVRRAT